jgi:hypothetical protein
MRGPIVRTRLLAPLITTIGLAVLAVPAAHATGITPGCDVTTYQGAVCAVRGYIALRQDPKQELGPPGQIVQCYFARKRRGHPHGDPRWSCHAEVAGRFVVYQMDSTGRPEIWQILTVTVSHG